MKREGEEEREKREGGGCLYTLTLNDVFNLVHVARLLLHPLSFQIWVLSNPHIVIIIIIQSIPHRDKIKWMNVPTVPSYSSPFLIDKNTAPPWLKPWDLQPPASCFPWCPLITLALTCSIFHTLEADTQMIRRDHELNRMLGYCYCSLTVLSGESSLTGMWGNNRNVCLRNCSSFCSGDLAHCSHSV